MRYNVKVKLTYIVETEIEVEASSVEQAMDETRAEAADMVAIADDGTYMRPDEVKILDFDQNSDQ